MKPIDLKPSFSTLSCRLGARRARSSIEVSDLAAEVASRRGALRTARAKRGSHHALSCDESSFRRKIHRVTPNARNSAVDPQRVVRPHPLAGPNDKSSTQLRMASTTALPHSTPCRRRSWFGDVLEDLRKAPDLSLKCTSNEGSTDPAGTNDRKLRARSSLRSTDRQK